MLDRVPIRLRLVAVFALVMAIVLGGAGAVIYLRTADELDRQLDRELDARLAGVLAIVNDDGDDLGDPRQDPLRRVDPRAFVQVLSPSGRIAGGTPEPLADVRLTDDETALRLLADPGRSVDVQLPDGESIRIVADTTIDDQVRYAVFVGASLDNREDTLSSLGKLILFGCPLALLVACAAGYWVASSALRPVTRLAKEATAISASDTSGQLTVPPARDEVRDLAENLNLMLARLGAALDRERRFVADASHELRTPLSVMTTELELARTGERSPEELRAALDSAAAETARLVSLAEDLLIIARAEDGRLPVRREVVRVREIAEAAVGRVSVPPDRPVLVDVDPAVTVSADRVRLEQALSNLVSNAIGHGAGKVTVGCRRLDGGGVLRVFVIDEGAGIDAATAAGAFERFSRGPDSRSVPGSGLGLAIVAAIAAGHDGSAGIGPLPDGGTMAWIDLPCDPGSF